MARPRRVPFLRGLSFKLLLLTVFFVMLAEVMIYAPSIARFRQTYLLEHVRQAQLVLTALESTPVGVISTDLRRRLLADAGALGVMARGLSGTPKAGYNMLLAEDMPPRVDAEYDLRDDDMTDYRQGDFFRLIGDAFAALVRSGDRNIAVSAFAPMDPSVVIRVILAERPMIEAMWAFSWRILGLSLFISGVAAGLVYFSLIWLLVRPMERITENIMGFRAAPEDRRWDIQWSGRTDEVGVAEQELAAMQRDLRQALTQQARLAGVGAAVTKITHDLKGVLTTALLESDRLEMAAGDPEVKEVTAGIARALDRAVQLSTKTLAFAKEGPPEARLAVQPLRPMLEEALAPHRRALETSIECRADLLALADPQLMARVLDNLLRNAIEAKATTVRLSCGVEDTMAVVRVSDDGRGLPKKALDNLFQPFSGSARAGGTGLGLPIALELMQAQGGTLELEKTGPEGTTFRLCLQRA